MHMCMLSLLSIKPLADLSIGGTFVSIVQQCKFCWRLWRGQQHQWMHPTASPLYEASKITAFDGYLLLFHYATKHSLGIHWAYTAFLPPSVRIPGSVHCLKQHISTFATNCILLLRCMPCEHITRLCVYDCELLWSMSRDISYHAHWFPDQKNHGG